MVLGDDTDKGNNEPAATLLPLPPALAAVGGECGLVFTFGLGGGGFMCIALSVAARRSINNVGEHDLIGFLGAGSCVLEEGDSLNCIGAFLRGCDSDADRDEE